MVRGFLGRSLIEVPSIQIKLHLPQGQSQRLFQEHFIFS
ncbi:hypothetical protein LEP1GSC076_2812 [Leptospira sp. Fiocruz LV4135]|nr:hypothetical protein LEP1GSC076_2812 [Leptospira sp. Fiocruz LV4135]